jgi:hypothetical protein
VKWWRQCQPRIDCASRTVASGSISLAPQLRYRMDAIETIGATSIDNHTGVINDLPPGCEK